MAEQQIVCSTQCTVTVVHEISVPPFNLDTADALSIALAVVSVWAVGFGFRVLIGQLKDDGSTEERN